MPGGCFEQTSSSTYPDVLALDYMKKTKKLTPEVHAKAEGYIANGYQRLLTFEVPGGGFSWFGQAPANKILTAYGLMEFTDMAKVSDVDPKLIDRTREWLIRQQQPDGSWRPDTQFINEGATNRYNSDVLRITAYIAWSLANTGYSGPAVEKAKHYIEARANEKPDVYTLAVIANFAADYAKDGDFTRRSMQALLDARTEKDDQVSWSAEETGVYSTGASAAIETTGLAAQALLKWGQASEPTRKALNYLSSKKQASGNWGTTQATIMALRALLFASQLSVADVRGTVHIKLNGKVVETLELTRENSDLLHQFLLKGIDERAPTSVELSFEGTGGLAYQVVGRSFTPWGTKPSAEPLSIEVAYGPQQAGAKRYRHRNCDHPQQLIKKSEHGDGRSRHPARIRAAQRRPADAPGEDGCRTGRTSGEVFPYRNSGNPLLQRTGGRSRRLRCTSGFAQSVPFAPTPFHRAFTSITILTSAPSHILCRWKCRNVERSAQCKCGRTGV